MEGAEPGWAAGYGCRGPAAAVVVVVVVVLADGESPGLPVLVWGVIPDAFAALMGLWE